MSLEPCFPSSERATVASIADSDDTVTAVIYRHAEPLVPEAGLDLTVISVDGDVECDAAAYLGHILHQAIDGGTPVCCDLSRAGYLGAAGASAVLSAAHRATATDTVLILRGVQTLHARVLQIFGFDPALIIT